MTISKNPASIREMFNTIAEVYDFNNNLISMGLHRYIKLKSVQHLTIKNGMKILDECTGTGDFAEFIYKINPNTEICGADFSENMLKIARKKVPEAKFIQADCTNLPFDDNSFDIITMGFGLRNIENYNKAISESYRVLKSGGQLLHLDFGQKNFFSAVFDFVIPPLVKIFYGKNLPYKYLIQSKKEFPEPEKLIEIFRCKGFKSRYRKDYLFGVISMQIMTK